jgi:Ca2+:H+ antiporter
VTRRLSRGEIASLAAAVVLAVAAAAADLASAPNTVVFVLSALALLMLAWMVGISTEQLGASAGPRVGGVLNATFGNAAELIITFFAIRDGQLDVAAAAITGSILGNTLLVLGLSFLAGGLRNGVQTFDQRLAGMNASMLVLAVIGLGIPTAFSKVAHTQAHVQAISDVTAAILIVLYVLSLIFTFQLPGLSREAAVEADSAGEAHLGARVAIALLVVSTVAVAVISDVFVGTLDGVIASVGISAAFLGLVIVPIVGNVAENIVAIRLAWRNQTDFSMVVSLGSSLQVALGVAPLLVFLSLFTSHEFSLVFPVLQVLALIAAVTITSLIALDGESNWLEGAQLIAVYLIIATTFWYL